MKTADLIVTTVYHIVESATTDPCPQPEKWDALTRRGSTSSPFLHRLALMMIDEVSWRFESTDMVQVHILRESRGATLEVVVSRMKTRGEHVRFIAVSASVRFRPSMMRPLNAVGPEYR